MEPPSSESSSPPPAPFSTPPLIRNAHLHNLPVDFLYHFGLDSSQPLRERFGHVQYVCMGGSPERMKAFARDAGAALGFPSSDNISTTDRYALYHIGPVLAVSHGMGGPSISIMLHEITKLLHYAQAKSVYIRVGTSGGLGLPPGSVVVSDKALNGALEPYHTVTALGKHVHRPALFHSDLSSALVAAAPDDVKPRVVVGCTMSCDDFYEGQGRLDGALCGYSEADKLAFLQRAYAAGVRNIEMEGLVLASFSAAVGVPAAMVCVTLLDRLLGDQIPPVHPDTSAPQTLVIAFIRQRLAATATAIAFTSAATE